MLFTQIGCKDTTFFRYMQVRARFYSKNVYFYEAEIWIYGIFVVLLYRIWEKLFFATFSCAFLPMTYLEYPPNHPVITPLSPPYHPLLRGKKVENERQKERLKLCRWQEDRYRITC